MKSIFRAVIAAVILLATAVFSSAGTGSVQAVLTSFDFDVVGVGLKASPEYQAVPKGIASRVNTAFEAAGFDLSAMVDKLPQDYKVLAELTGPAFLQPKTLETKPGVPFDLPTLALTGRYTLANIRLVDGNYVTLFGSVPQLVAIESIPDPLVTSVTTRQLTQQELQERGVTFDRSNFTAYEFTAGIATSSGQVPITLPVIIPNSQTVQETPVLVGSSPISLPQSQVYTIPPEVPETAMPLNMEAYPVVMEVQEKDKVDKLVIPPIPGVVVIPGNIGFLHQYFSALALVTNGAPLQSGLSIRNVSASVSFPAGEDLIPGSDEAPGDDPLRMAKGANGYFPRIMPAMNAGVDGKAGTADDSGVMLPGESGQADFTIEGLKEGTHKVDFDITATLEGLPIGPVTLKGKASGAILVRNPDFSVTLGHPATVRAGEEYDLFIIVSNTGKSIANLVSAGLDPRALSGAIFVDGEANSKSIGTILPGSAATIKFRLKSQRTGKVTATAFESSDVKGRFILRSGVGENGIPLSPDSLILPYTGTLPSDLVTSAVGLLGQAWSVATAPAGALPASVLPISKSTITSRAYDLSEAGLRVLIGDNQVKAVEDLTFDLFGSDVYSKGFDSLRRSSTMGLEMNRAIAGIFKTGIDASGVISFQAALADKVSYRPGHLSIIATGAPLRMRLTDAAGNRTGAVDAAVASRGIPYADSFAIGENGASRSNLILATRLDSPSYTLDLAADAAATFDLGILLPDAAGVLTQYGFSGVTLPAATTARMSILTGSGELQLAIDDNNDGTIDRTIIPSSAIAISDHAPHIVAATQLTPGFGPGGDKHGRNVALLFSERVIKESVQNIANYAVDENLVKQATIQPGSRMAFLLLRDGIGTFFNRSLTVQGLTDPSGRSMSQPETLPVRITAQGPAAVVTGTVRTARGEPVPNATIRLYQLIWYDNPITFEIEQRYALFTEKQANSDGSYRLEYVLQNDPTGVDPSGPFQIEVVNPVTGEIGSLTTSVIYHGQRLQLDIFMKARGALSGVVKNESGNPVSGATVQVITLADNRGKTMTTDASGTFSFTGLMVGAYNLKAISQAALSEGSIMGVLPEDGTAVSQDLTIRKVGDVIRGTVVGKVLGVDGVTPRSGVVVILNGTNYQNWMRTATDGSFNFSGVYAGSVTVTARDDSTGEQSTSGGTISTSGQSIALNVIMKGTGTVAGTVSRDDNKSAAGLYVVAHPPSPARPRVLQTDATGAFRIESLPTGNITIEVLDPNDFNRTVASGSVTILSAGDTANIALFVPLKAMATGTISGTVYHRDGTPWANAPIKRLVNSYQYFDLQADSNGKFSIPALALGSYRFSVAAGNEVINISTDLWWDSQVSSLELRPVVVGSVTGTTWDDAAMTMPTGADVTLVSMKPDQVGWLGYDTGNATVVKSDPSTGRFSIGNVFQGSFTVSSSNIFRPTPVSAGGKIETDGQTVNINLPLKGSPPKPGDPPPVNQPGSISGRVLMPDGSPAGKDVRVTVTFGGADVTVTTNEQGLFNFAPLIPAGNQPIIAEDPVTTLKWKGSVYVPSGLDVPVTIKLLGRGTVAVKVLNASGAAIPDAVINLKGTSYPNDTAGGASDASGQATFYNLSEGSYAVSASGTGSLSGLSGRNQVTIPGDKASVTVQVSLAPSATVTGRFLKADGVTPIAGGQITLKRNGQAIAYTSSSSDPADPGRFRLEQIPLGDFSVEGYDPVTERRGSGGGRLATDGETVPADVVVTPRGTVKGMVLNYGGSAPVGAAPINISFNGGSYSSVTAPDGSFLFTGVAAGRFTIDAADPVIGLHGQASGSLSYENETVTSQVRIAPTGSISGRVLMPDGQTPLAVATVRLNGGSQMAVDSVTGIFRYDNLAAGQSYSLSSSQPGTHRSGSTIATISRDLEVANGDIILRGVGQVSGTVFEPDGQTPLAGAKVELHFLSEVLTGYSAADGSFGFSDIPAGSFTIVAFHTLRTTAASQSGYLSKEGETVTRNLVLGPIGSVKATVLLADGVTPSRGGGIRITTTYGNSTNVYTGITGSSGQYTFSNIPTPCSVALYVEDAAGVGIGRFFGVLDTNGQVLDTGTIVLDDKPISVTAINPANGAVNVPVNQAIRILFSEPADIATLNINNIYLAQGTSRIAGSLQIDADNSGVTFTPSVPLKGFTLYTMVVKTDVKDRAWRNLAQAQSVSFSTVDNIPPEVSSISPANGSLQIAADAVVRITFSEPLDAGSLAGIALTSGGTAVPARIDLIQGGMVVALTPLEPFSLNRSYSVTVSGVKDSAGNSPSATVQSSFDTIDTIVPAITSLIAAAGADLIKGSSVPVTAAVLDSDVARVDFYLDEQLIGTVSKAPYTLAVLMGKEGTAHLKAIAQDRVGNRGLPATLDLVIAADQPPQLAFTAPADGSSVNTGSAFSVTLQGTDDLGLKEITLTLSGEMSAVQTKAVSGKSAVATFTFTASAGIAGSGSITLTATAKDSGGNTTVPIARTVTLHDSIAPTAISLASLGQNVKYKPGETAAAIFTASDNVAVTVITCTASGAVTDSRTYAINPALVSVSQTYEFTVPAGASPYALVNVTCIASDAAGNSSSKTIGLTVADIVPPTVSSASIADNALNIPTNSSFTINFSETLSAATVTTASVVMTGAGQAVSGSVILSGDRKSITFKPAVSLARGAAYTLTLTTGISDDVGNSLAASYIVTFTTDNAPPQVASVTPATGSVNVPVGSAISVSFNEQIDPASVTADKVSLTSISGAVPGALTVSSDGLSLTFKPYNQLGFSRAYTFTLSAGIKDISGNATTSTLTANLTTQGPDSDLVGYWPMDGDWTDYSGNGHNGSTVGNPTFTSDHVVGTQAGSFKGGSDYVAVGNLYGSFPNNAFSIEAWVNLADTGNGGRRTIAGGTGAWADYAIGLNSNQFVVYNYNGQSNSSGYYAYSGSTQELGKWHHLAGTFDGSRLKLFVNGELKSDIPAVWGQSNGGANFWIGSENCCGGNNFNGLIDDVSLYKRALLPEDVFEHYNAGLTADRTPPAAPTVDPVTTPTFSNQIVLRGTKEAGSSIRVNGKQIVAQGANTTWQALYTLTLGQNLLAVSSHDLAGNVSPAVNLVVDLLPGNLGDPVTPKPVVAIISPGQTTRYKPGETGTATVTATNPNGIAKLYCNASGAVSEGTLVVPVVPPQTSITQQFTFRVSPTAGPYAPYKLSCVAETASGTLGSYDLDLQAEDIVLPTVTGSSIDNVAAGVIATLPITVTFSEAMQTSSINSATVQLFRTDTGVAVAGTITIAADGKTFSFIPAAALDGATAYRLAIAAGVTDIAGNQMGSGYVLQFTTQAAVALTITGKGSSSAPYVVSSGRYTNIVISSSYVVFEGLVAADTVSLANSSTLSHYGASTTASYKLDLQAQSISIDATSRIDASGRGYLGAWQGGNSTYSGRTLGNTTSGSSSGSSGGSYGGLGGTLNGSANGAYGDMTNPNELGSGGGTEWNFHPAGNGGGLVRIKTGSLTLDGSIQANGGGGDAGSGGSGGGIRIEATTVAGTGVINAKGGSSNQRAGGGGGRIAIHYGTMNLPTSNIMANSGTGTKNGGAGTVYLKNNAMSKADVIINNGGIAAGTTTSVPGGDYGYVVVKGGATIAMNGNLTPGTDMVVSDSQLYLLGEITVPGNLTINNSGVTSFGKMNIAGSLAIINNSTLSHYVASTAADYRLDLQAKSISIDATSRIDASGRGYLGAWQGGNSTYSGRTLGNTTSGSSSGSSGGSYGGLGGTLNGSANGAYGDMTNPNELGSGGGTEWNFHPAGNGGGLVRIKTGSLTLDGSIQANGGGGDAGSGGSGGGIRIEATTVAGTGVINAKGGSSNQRAGGGGGRIAIHYGTMNLPTSNIIANSGTGTKNGGAGTVYLKSTIDSSDSLIVDNRGIDAGEGSTPIHALGSGVVTDLTATSITTSGAAWQPGTLKGLKFNPDVTKNKLFTIVDNDATTLLIDPTEGDLTQVTAMGLTYAGTYAFTKMTVAGKARVSCLDRFVIATELTVDGSTFVSNNIAADKVTVKNSGLLSHWPATTAATYRMELNAITSANIDSTSSIDASGRGYLGAWQGGNSTYSGRTLGNTTSGSSSGSSGGSYGGLGGTLNGSANGAYGDMTNPNELGSGGGTEWNFHPAGNGGGLVRIKTGSLTLDGSIQANGGGGDAGSGGSGGGIRIEATTVAGTGVINAKGGSSNQRAGGGGGRIAIHYGTMNLPQANVTASGGTGTANGGAGTIHYSLLP
jgi:hypothetical protein